MAGHRQREPKFQIYLLNMYYGKSVNANSVSPTQFDLWNKRIKFLQVQNLPIRDVPCIMHAAHQTNIHNVFANNYHLAIILQ